MSSYTRDISGMQFASRLRKPLLLIISRRHLDNRYNKVAHIIFRLKFIYKKLYVELRNETRDLLASWFNLSRVVLRNRGIAGQVAISK